MHWELGRMVWEKCGMARDRQGLEEAIATIPKLREQFWHEVSVPGEAKGVNPALEQAPVADFMEFAELFAETPCTGGILWWAFRTECQTEDGEALRNDDDFAYVAAWEHQGEDHAPALHKESLNYQEVKMTQRSYK